MAFLKVKNRAISTLASGISDSDLSLTVATGEGALFPSTYPFHITIEDEILECTNRSTDVLTVTRAAEDTIAAAHAADKTVKLRITAAIITELQTAVDAHASQHQWLGDDALNLKDLVMGTLGVFRVVNMGTFSGFTELVSETGATASGYAYWALSTGATQNSVACRYADQNDWFSTSWYWRVFARINLRTIATGHKLWIGVFATPTAPTNAQKSVCFEIDTDGKIYASCGDGTDANRVDTGVTITLNTNYDLYFKYMADDIKFYIGVAGTALVLKATLTDYRPIAANVKFTAYESNPGVAEDRVAWVYAVRMLAGEE